MANVKEKIISQGCIIVGSGQFAMGSENKIERTRNLAEVFIDSVMSDIFLAVKWPFALKLKRDIAGDIGTFVEAPIQDCIRVAVISPSSVEWFVNNERLYFKGTRIDAVFYYSADKLKSIISYGSIEETSLVHTSIYVPFI